MSEKPKRRWYQFSLKSMLVVLTLLCLGPGGYVAYEQNKARKQKAAVEVIEKLGGEVDYDQAVLPRSALFRAILGDEASGNVWVINLNDTQVTDADLKHVTALKHLYCLSLDDTRVTDSGIVPLADLKRLARLSLKGTQVTDASLVHLAGLKRFTYLALDNTEVSDAGLKHLSGLSELEFLWVRHTQVTDVGVAELQKALPNCRIIH